VLGVVLGFLEFGYNGRQAVDGPRIDHQWMPDRGSVEIDATPPIPQSTLDALAAMGHNVRAGGGGSAHSIWVDLTTGIAYGVRDKRANGSFAAK
jgi:gamma-glutamyltranspeptidase